MPRHRLLTTATSIVVALVPGTLIAQAPSPAVSPRYAVRVDSAHREVVVTLGPYDIPADSGMAHMMSSIADDELSPIIVWPLRAAIRGYRLTVADSTGRPLSRRLLHHYGVVQLDRRELAYPTLQNLLGGGAETADVVLPTTVGIPLEAGDRFAVYFMWKNHTGHGYHGVSLQLRFLLIPANQQPRPVLAMPFWLDVNYHPGGSDEYDVPPGGCTRVFAFTLPVSGRLLAVSGHLHRYGTSLRLVNAESGAGIVSVLARRDSDGTVRAMSRHLFGIFGEGPHLTAGQRYTLVVSYDNPTPDTLRGMMGVLGGLFVPDDPAAWPALDRSNAIYIRGRDLRIWESAMSRPSATALWTLKRAL